MKIVIAAVGSTGDVAPYTGLAAHLIDQGHDVAIATQELFADMVRGCGAEFRLIPGDIQAAMASEDGEELQRGGGGLRGMLANLRLARTLVEVVGEGMITATEDADVLLLNRGTMFHGYLLAKARGIRGYSLELFPMLPTTEFSLGEPTNSLVAKAFHWLVDQVVSRVRTPVDSALRDFQKRIGLKPSGLAPVYDAAVADLSWPVLHGYSPTLLPRPHDWRENSDVVGYWWPHRSPDWQPPADLVDFLDAGPAPVFVGFGSMSPGKGEPLSELVLEALPPGTRAVFQTGWAGLSAHGDDVLTVDHVPHDWLFPRMAAVVHHGGAGTTGAGLRAGVPTVSVPVLGDQPFWSRRLEKIGTSPGWIPAAELTTAGLGKLVRRAVAEPYYRKKAKQIAESVNSEDAFGHVAKALENG
ncbi:glycosyltransferase [Allokutzneria albata]|uniref:UDP:flavonoid glycosyltransferase YjiC, YdhE family n=1 Tax=Allokutzneria albata TaxID=211114 RepID=A0A1G9UEH6_ALLAB|nr:glycosyltransferase [Allokutzneria albata]SDM58312.1 UDP:flavonoid glycosyltransferase YjiC, YdhE family [Allokutzneria albata]